MKQFDKDFFGPGKIANYKYVVGHNRAATVGGLSTAATHPFQEGPITMVHNGTLFRTTTLPLSEHDLGAHNDSHAICHNLALYDAEEVIGKLDGAFALIWHDARDDSLNIIRNDKRPLHMSISSYNDTIYFASEGEMLHWLDTRLKLGLQEIVQPKVGHLLRFLPDNLMKPEVKKVELETYPKATYSYGGIGKASNDYIDWWRTTVEDEYNYNPDDDDLSGGGGSTTGKDATTTGRTESTLTPSTTVLVSGQRRAVPTTMQERLLNFDLLVEDVLSFAPQHADSVVEHNGNLVRKTNTVHGYLVLEDRNHVAHCAQAIIYGTRDNVWESCNNRLWSVQPIGVMTTAHGEPLVVCKFLSSLNPYGNLCKIPEKLEDIAPTAPVQHDFDDEIPFAADDMVLGPYGTRITLQRFEEKTKYGCADCTGNILPEDAPDILWVNGEQDPLCKVCANEYSNVEGAQ